MRVALIVLIIFPHVFYAQDAHEIINRYIDTVSNGNFENWKTIRSVYMESIGAYSQGNFQQKPDFDLMKPDFSKHYMVWPDKHRIETYTDSTCSQLLSTFTFLKDKIIIIMGNVPPMIKPKSGESENFQFTPVLIQNMTHKNKAVRLLGTKEFAKDSIVCYEIEVHDKKDSYRLFFNTRTYLLEYWSKSIEGDFSSLTRYTNYEKFGDFLIPTTEVSSKNEIPFFWTQIKKMEFNIPVDPEKFNYKTD